MINLMKIFAAVASDPPHIGNQYLIHHSLQEEELARFDLNIDSSVQGSYLFLQRGEEEVELKTLLEHNPTPLAKEKFIAQLKMYTALTDGGNLKTLEIYRSKVWDIAPYLYKENYPILIDPSVVKAALEAIAKMEFRLPPCLQLANNNYVTIVEPETLESREARGEGQPYRIKLKSQKDLSTRTLKEMYSHFLRTKVVRDGLDEPTLIAWLKIAELALALRLITVQDKRSSQWVQYFKKIFEGIDHRKNMNSQERPTRTLIEFLIEIVRKQPKYANYLRFFELRIYNEPRSEGNRRWINSYPASDYFTKNQFIDYINLITAAPLLYPGNSIELVYKQKLPTSTLHERENQLSFSAEKSSDFHDPYAELKTAACRVLAYLLQNISEEELGDSMESIACLIRQPTHFRGVELAKTPQSFPLENEAQFAILQCWYLARESSLVAWSTDCLRILFKKQTAYRQAIQDMHLIDQPRQVRFYEDLQSQMEQVKKLVYGNMQSWLEPTLVDFYPEYLTSLGSRLANIEALMERYAEVKNFEGLQRLLAESGLLNVIHAIWSFIAMRDLTKNMYLKLERPISSMIRLLNFYVKKNSNHRGIVIFALGDLMTRIPTTSYFLAQVLKAQPTLALALSHRAFSNLLNQLPDSEAVFEMLLYLSDHDFLRVSNKLIRELKKKKDLEAQKPSCRAVLTRLVYRACSLGCSHYLVWSWEAFLQKILIEEAVQNRKLCSRKGQIGSSVSWRQTLVFFLRLYRGSQLAIVTFETVSAEFLLSELHLPLETQQTSFAQEYLEYYCLDLLPTLRPRTDLFFDAKQLPPIRKLIDQLCALDPQYSTQLEATFEGLVSGHMPNRPYRKRIDYERQNPVEEEGQEEGETPRSHAIKTWEKAKRKLLKKAEKGSDFLNTIKKLSTLCHTEQGFLPINDRDILGKLGQIIQLGSNIPLIHEDRMFLVQCLVECIPTEYSAFQSDLPIRLLEQCRNCYSTAEICLLLKAVNNWPLLLNLPESLVDSLLEKFIDSYSSDLLGRNALQAPEGEIPVMMLVHIMKKAQFPDSVTICHRMFQISLELRIDLSEFNFLFTNSRRETEKLIKADPYYCALEAALPESNP